jgi:hypothetical protein
MIDFEQIKTWFPANFQHKQYARFVLREYMQYQILDFLANSRYAKHLCFIGGTNLRLIHGIDRFSEDLDFDHKDFLRADFLSMTNSVLIFLEKSGYTVIADDKNRDNELKAFRRSIVFPEFLYQQKLSPYKEEKFLIKIESQDQGIIYRPEKSLLNGCGYIFRINTPPLPVLCSMKISALLNRKKGRDFFDTMFLLGKTDPDYNFLSETIGVKNKEELKNAFSTLLETVNITHKSKDFEHLLFISAQNNRILLFKDFIDAW